MSNTIEPIIFDLNDVRKKAENGDKFACYILGRSYDSEENGAEQSFEKAMYWYGKGKELGDPRSAYGVGACYYFGDGVEQDKEKAKQIHVEAYKPLLELINEEEQNPRKQAFSKFCLGANFYYNGVGTEKNLKLSEYYLKMAVDAGLPRAKTKYEQYKSEYESELEK